MTTMVNPTWVQSAYRGRSGDTVAINDNTTWAANLNVGWSQDVDVTFRVRIEVEETATANQNNTLSPQLEYNLGGAGWNPVTTTSSVVKAVASGQFNEGDATTNILSSSALGFVASTGSEDGLAGNATLSNQHTEAEFSVQILSGDVVNNDTIELRISNAGVALNTYSQTPSITVVEAANNITVTPTTASLTTSPFAPSVVLGTIVTPSTLALTTATFAPTVTATQNQLLTPGVKALTLTTYVPLVIIVSHGQQIDSSQGSVTPGQLYEPTTASLSLATFAPTVTASEGSNVTVTPSTLSLSLATFAPTVTLSANQIVTPETASLSTATFAPTVTTTANIVVTPDVTSLSLSAFAPEVTASGAPVVVVTPRVIGRGRRSFVEIDGQTLEVSGFEEAERLLNRIKKAEKAQEQDRKRVTILLGEAKGPQNVGLYRAQEQVEVIEKRIDDRAEKIAQLYAMILQNLDHDDDDEEMFFL
jgi:hypothetical protein